jgi:hypothetical protein
VTFDRGRGKCDGGEKCYADLSGTLRKKSVTQWLMILFTILF